MNNNNSEENFDQLRKLLKLKRYEQPPPGYFNDFSQRVIARLETVDSEHAGFLSPDARWAKRLVRMLENNPLFGGGFGVAVCALLIYGVLSFQYVDRTSVAMMGDDGNATHATLVSKADSTTFTSSLDPKLATNISGGSPFGSLSLSAQPNNGVEPVMFNPGQ
jgi:hypothetical protein